MKPDHELAEKVKNARESRDLTLKDLGKLVDVAYTTISEFERTGKASRNAIQKICNYLDLDFEFNSDVIDEPLKVGFTLSHWPAPLVWINEQLGGGDFFRKVSFTCSSDEFGKPIFNEPGRKLMDFNPETDNFYFSGEIKRLIIDEELDIGFLGSDVLIDEPDIVKVARIMCATEVRHHIAVVSPSKLSLSREQLIEILINEGNTDLPKCALFYHPNSTAQYEFSKLFLRTINSHDTLEVSPIHSFRENFKAMILEGHYTIYAYIGILLTSDAVNLIVDELGPNYKCEVILSNEIATYIDAQAVKQKEVNKNYDGYSRNSVPKLPPLYYDIITQRNNRRIRELVRSPGFSMLFKKLWEAIRVFNLEENKTHPNSLPNNKVADFFKMNKRATSDVLRHTEFELVFYPDWVQKALLLKP